MRPSVFILSQPKTATQSLFRTLKDSYPELGVFHAHTLDRADRMLATAKPGMSEEDHNHWRYRLSKQYHLLRSLLDARSQKTVVAVLREPVDRWSSALFYSHAKYITPCFDPVAQAYRLDQLRDALATTCRELLSDDLGYYARNYSILGIPQEAFAGGYRVTRVRDDLQVVTLTFESLANDFARLLEHLGLPPSSLVHLNVGRDRSLDVGSDPYARDAAAEDRRLYALFQRDFRLIWKEASASVRPLTKSKVSKAA